MTAEIASLDRVKTAMTTLRQRGVNATADRVIELIGGSKSTVLQHMRSIRQFDVQDTSVPPAIFEMARQALIDIFEAGRQAEEDRMKVLSERMAGLLAEQEAQIQELADENAGLLERQSILQKNLDEARALVASLNDKAADQQSASEQLRAALSEFQAMVAEATATKGNGPPQQNPSKA